MVAPAVRPRLKLSSRSLPAPGALIGALLTLGLACSAGGSGDKGNTNTNVSGASDGGGMTADSGSSGSATISGSAGKSQGGGGSSAGSGGTLSAGSGGTPSAGSGGEASGKSGCELADILCLSFDDVTSGSMPQGAPFQPYNCAGQATSMDLLVEDGKGKGGSKALTSKKSLNGGCNLLADLGDHAELWVTADVMFSAGVPVGTIHELTPFEVTKTATDDPGIRPGIRADASCNSWQGAELNITGGGERTGCTAFKFMTEQWYCLEIQIKNQAAAVEGDLHIDGVKQPFHIHQDEATTVINPDWTGAKLLRLGSRSYSSEVQSPVYVDNLSVSTTRVGCTQ